ncbi:hypothetical protein ASC78_17305 [Variovorax sp. Root318D1]|nr:hypothetical protein ASC78_17305 [Variovorax sp. Root318D1]
MGARYLRFCLQPRGELAGKPRSLQLVSRREVCLRAKKPDSFMTADCCGLAWWGRRKQPRLRNERQLGKNLRKRK